MKQFVLLGADGFVIPSGLVLFLETHPMTGQILLITAEPVTAKDLNLKLPRFLGKVEDTAHPHIKHAIHRVVPGAQQENLRGIEQTLVRWKDFKP